MDLILSAMVCKCITLGFPLKIGTPRYQKRMWPMLKPTKFVNIYKLSLGIEPTYMMDLVPFTI